MSFKNLNLNSSNNKDTIFSLKVIIDDLMSVVSNDILLNIENKNKSLIKLSEFPIEKDFLLSNSTQIKKILHFALKQKKNYDIYPLCITKYLFVWNYNNKEYKTPLILYPIHFKYFKNIDSFHCNICFEDIFINPILLSILKKEFNIDFQFNSENEIKNELDCFFNILKSNFIKFSIQENSFIGNFHYHRFEVLKDLEGILKENNSTTLLNSLLGNDDYIESITHKLDEKNLFPIDPSQSEILDIINNSSIVVQGPPGTGKSHLLCNIIGKLIHFGSFHLVSSEKKSTLDVIEKKISTFSLNKFAYICHSNSRPSEFIKKLKDNWLYFENLNFNIPKIENSSLKLYLNKLEMFISWYNKQEIFSFFSINYLINFENKIEFLKASFNSNLPSYKNWIDIKDNLLKLEKNKKLFPIFSFLKIKLNKEINSDIYKQISSFKNIYDELKNLLKIETFSNIKELVKLSIYIQLYENECNKPYFKTLLTFEKRKTLEKEHLKYLKIEKELALWVNEMKIWKEEPSKLLVNSILEKLTHKKKISTYFFKRKINKFLNTDVVDLKTLCEKTIKYLKIKEQKNSSEQKLHSLGIIYPDKELYYVYHISKQVDKISDNDWKTVLELDGNKRDNILKNSSKIKQLEQNFLTFFYLNETVNLQFLLDELYSNFSLFIENYTLIRNIPNSVLEYVRNKFTINEIEVSIIKTEWLKIQSIYPEFSKYNYKLIIDSFDKINNTFESESKLLVHEISQKKAYIFNQYNSILRTQSSKLNTIEKEFKQKLKNGKKILVHEFSKQKSHKSVFELLNSDAKLWIEVLCPIFFSTTSSIAVNFPLIKGFFEFSLFDESSQIFLTNAIGAIYRSNKIIIAGDEQQMSPSLYFKKTKSSIDLLHQSSYYLEKKSLNYHYRSKNSNLINFSNKYFYNNKLLVYPSFPLIKDSISWVYCSNGIYENRENKVEALELVNHLKKLFNSNKKVGVVCFSEKQLSLVYSLLSIDEQLLIINRIKENTMFFKALEQVQGDECDVLLISFAYARDKYGKFNQQFGPLNHTSGSKRLNVLFTRAKENIILFTSIKPNDFPISVNESINLFRQYLLSLVNKKTIDFENQFPYRLEYEIINNKLTIKKPFVEINNPLELYTFYNVMRKRNWEIELEF